jgi:selenide,water dikinase
VLGLLLERALQQEIAEGERIDAARICLADAATLLTTTDLLYLPVPDVEESASIIVAHCLSDIYAELGEPLWATVTLGLTSADVASERAERLLRGIANALEQAATRLAGGHTTYAPETFVGISAVGREAVPPAHAPCAVGDLVLLSKTIGSGIALAALKMGFVADTELGLEVSSMRASNAPAAAAISAQDSSEVRYVTDVSGFGLISAIAAGSLQATVRVAADRIAVFPQTLERIRGGAWSALADSNLARALDVIDSGSATSVSLATQMALCDPQTSGGLVAIMSPDAAAGVVAADVGWTAIGEVIATNAGPLIQIEGEIQDGGR